MAPAIGVSSASRSVPVSTNVVAMGEGDVELPAPWHAVSAVSSPRKMTIRFIRPHMSSPVAVHSRTGSSARLMVPGSVSEIFGGPWEFSGISVDRPYTGPWGWPVVNVLAFL